MEKFKPVILYDGKCNFCIAIVKFIFKKDHKNLFRYAVLQSKDARAMLRQFKINFIPMNTLYYIKNEDQIMKKSQAVFEIIKMLPFPWNLFSIFKFLPAKFTDYTYDVIARYRYRIFGKKDRVVFPSEISEAGSGFFICK